MGISRPPSSAPNNIINDVSKIADPTVKIDFLTNKEYGTITPNQTTECFLQKDYDISFTETKDYKFVRWEIEQAISRGLPIIVVNINGKRCIDKNLCPAIVRDELAVHISFNAKILQYALENWPSFYEANKSVKTGPYYYSEEVYRKLGL